MSPREHEAKSVRQTIKIVSTDIKRARVTRVQLCIFFRTISRERECCYQHPVSARRGFDSEWRGRASTYSHSTMHSEFA